MSDTNTGLQRGKVHLLSHQSTWSEAFQAEKVRLRTVFRDQPIEHVGSTAVMGLAAKPIIDIPVAVDALAEVEDIIQPLVELGYEYKGEAGTPGRRFFAKGSEEKRTVYLHVGLPDGEFGSLIKFRDALRSHPSLVKEYDELKRTLASKFSHNRKAYTSGKSRFIQRALQDDHYITLRPAAEDDKATLSNLLQDYQMELLGEAEAYQYLPSYFTDSDRSAFFIHANHKLAGFALINRHTLIEKDAHSIAEFYILPRFRRQGVGERAAELVLKQFPGKWEVAQMQTNKTAIRFWRKVIGDVTGGKYKEIALNSDTWRGPVQTFVI